MLASLLQPFRRVFVWLLLAMLSAANLAHADLKVEVIGGGSNRYPLAVLPLQNEQLLAESLTDTVRSDLAMSGAFSLLDSAGQQSPASSAQLDVAGWQARNARAVVHGKVSRGSDGRLKLAIWAETLSPREEKLAAEFDLAGVELRDVAHRAADMIYEALLGEKSLFASRIAFVTRAGREYRLQISDVDGRRAQTVLRSFQPIMSPTWSPDGRKLAYVSFEQQKPIIYLQDLSSGQRRIVANQRGSNSAPAFSPDGKLIAATLTLSGNSQIYLMNSEGGNLRRFSYSDAIDTEPAFSPDGRQIVFVSDRSGSPQLYIQPLDGSAAARRVTFQGNYNVSPTFSPDGRQIAYISREGGRFRVMLLDLASGDHRLISNSAFDESPSFSPNGKMVLFASVESGRSVLFAAVAGQLGRVKLGTLNGEVQDPAWGPFNR